MNPIIRSDRGTNHLSSYILHRIESNKNFIAGITGQTGSGKTYSALRLCETVDKDFDISNVCFSAREFMNLINGKTKKLKRGSAILYDELQVSMGSLDYQSLSSKLINACLSTFRHKNFILFCTMPYFSMINKQTRQLFHCRAETISINRNEKTCAIKPLMLQVSQSSGVIYQKYLRIVDRARGSTVPLTRLHVSLPSKTLLEAYEERKEQFTKALNEDISRQLDEAEGKKQPRLTIKQENVKELLLDGKTVKEIALEMDVSEAMIRSHIGLMANKGVRFRRITDSDNHTIRYILEGDNVRDNT